MVKISRCVLVAVQLSQSPQQGDQITLPLTGTVVQPGTLVTAVEVISGALLNEGPNGVNATNGTFDFTLTLKSKASVERTQNMPLGLIDPTQNGGALRVFEPFYLDMQASYIQLTGPGANYTPSSVVYLNFYIVNELTGI